jgi:hypothetical protein
MKLLLANDPRVKEMFNAIENVILDERRRLNKPYPVSLLALLYVDAAHCVGGELSDNDISDTLRHRVITATHGHLSVTEQANLINELTSIFVASRQRFANT